MYVICQNDFPLIIVDTDEEEAERIKNEIQRRCDEQTKKQDEYHYRDWPFSRRIFVHMHNLPIISEFNDIDNKLYWQQWSEVAHIKSK